MFCHRWTFPQILQPWLVPLERGLLRDQEGALFPIASHYTLQERCKDQRNVPFQSWLCMLNAETLPMASVLINWSKSSAALIMQMRLQLFFSPAIFINLIVWSFLCIIDMFIALIIFQSIIFQKKWHSTVSKRK